MRLDARKTWLDNLKPGDQVIYWTGVAARTPALATVERLTKTQIVLAETVARFRRSDGRAIGSCDYHRRAIDPPTDTLRHQVERLALLTELAGAEWRKKPTPLLKLAVSLLHSDPGAPIARIGCPCCGAALQIEHGDEPGELGVVGSAEEIS